jgi:predicted phage terminase large subunit-like protein
MSVPRQSTGASKAPSGNTSHDEWRPLPGQAKLLRSNAFEVLFGGAAGPGKTDALIVCPLRWVDNPAFRGIIFRRTFPELEKAVIDRTQILYRAAVPGAKYNDQKKVWRFPSGAMIYFGHCEHENDIHAIQGAAFSYIGFDELTHFTEKQYTYLVNSRARSAAGLPIRIRSATNPGGPGHEWVMRRWGPWLDPESEVKAEQGEKLYYLNSPDGEHYCSPDTPGALSRQFIPGRLSENIYLAGKGYEQQLMGLDAVTRAQLLEGNWLVKKASGNYFKRGYFDIVDSAPVDVVARVRRWDLAATEPEKGRDPDWTVGLRLSRTSDGLFYVEDVTRFRESPHKVEVALRATAQLDGQRCAIQIPQDPGQAGKAQIAYLTKSLVGFNVRSEPESGDKVTRAQPVSAQSEARNIRLVRGPWNEAFIQELEQFPDPHVHDDQVDAFSGAFSALIGQRTAPIMRGVYAVRGSF